MARRRIHVEKGVHVKKGDKVVVIAGADKSKDRVCEILQVDAEKGRVLVRDVNVRWKHLRRSPQNPQGGRVQRNFPIDASNVMLWSEKAGKGVRTKIEIIDDKRVRVGKPCGTRFD